MAWLVGRIADTLGTMGNASSTESFGSQVRAAPVLRSSAATATCLRPPAEMKRPATTSPPLESLRLRTAATSPVGGPSPSTRNLSGFPPVTLTRTTSGFAEPPSWTANVGEIPR